MRPLKSCLFAALLLLCAAAAPPPPENERFVPGGRSGFVADGAGGCWVWVGGMSRDADNVIGTWTGACPGGPAEGNGRATVRWRENGQDHAMIYDGPVRRGQNEGQGRLQRITNGRVTAIEDGRFRDDRFVGGRFEVPSIGLVYEGGWGVGGPEGQGRLTLNGRNFEGVWESGCLRVGEAWITFTRPVQECAGVRI